MSCMWVEHVHLKLKRHVDYQVQGERELPLCVIL